MTRDIHALVWAGSSIGHRLTRTCACVPMTCFNLAQPSRVVFVHRVAPKVQRPRPDSIRPYLAARDIPGAVG